MKTPDSFQYVYEKYSGAILFLIRQMEPDHLMAGKLLGNFYKEMYRKIGDYNPAKERLFTWIYKITMMAVKCQSFPADGSVISARENE